MENHIKKIQKICSLNWEKRSLGKLRIFFKLNVSHGLLSKKRKKKKKKSKECVLLHNLGENHLLKKYQHKRLQKKKIKSIRREAIRKYSSSHHLS